MDPHLCFEFSSDLIQLSLDFGSDGRERYHDSQRVLDDLDVVLMSSCDEVSGFEVAEGEDLTLNEIPEELRGGA